MAPTNGKLEGRIVVPTGGYAVAIAEVGGGAGGTATIPAGNYYLSSGDTLADDLLQEWADQINGLAGTSGTYSVSIGAGENGTGKVTISATGITSFSVTWTSTVLRDLLGWTGTISGSLSYTAPEQAESLWLPDCAFKNLNGGSTWDGWIESNLRAHESPAGHVAALSGQRKKVSALEWQAISRAKVWTVNETTTNASLEKFYTDVVLAEASWAGRAGGPIRWYPDAATDSTYTTYSTPTWNMFKPAHLREGWTGRWVVMIDRLVKVPS